MESKKKQKSRRKGKQVLTCAPCGKECPRHPQPSPPKDPTVECSMVRRERVEKIIISGDSFIAFFYLLSEELAFVVAVMSGCMRGGMITVPPFTPPFQTALPYVRIEKRALRTTGGLHSFLPSFLLCVCFFFP